MPVKGLYFDQRTGKYEYDFRVRNHRFRGSTGTADRREAERIVKDRRVKAQWETDQQAGASAMTFAAASSRWYNERGAFRAKPSEVVRMLAWLQSEVGNGTFLTSINTAMVARLSSKRRAEGASPATINRTVLEPLRAILMRAAKVWEAPCGKVSWAELMEAEPRQRVREASEDEEARIVAALRPGYRDLVDFALLSALRMDELVSMRLEHIDFKGWRLSLVGKGGHVATIPLTDTMLTALKVARGDRIAGPVWTYRPARLRVGAIHSFEARPITINGLKKEWSRARKSAGLSSSRADALMGFRFHDLRHTALTRIVRATGNVAVAQKLARHQNIATTMRYVHASENDVREAMKTAQSSRKSPRDVAKSGKSRNSVKGLP